MADETRGFPSPDEFESYDEVESENGQAELPDDSFDETAAHEDEDGCECS
jgi:hypothetical protein